MLAADAGRVNGDRLRPRLQLRIKSPFVGLLPYHPARAVMRDKRVEIVFQRAALDRVTTVDLAGDAEFLGVETIVLGRAAMGEVVTRLHLHDRREIRRDGRLVLVDILRLDDAALAGGDAPHAVEVMGRAVAYLQGLVQEATDIPPQARDQISADLAHITWLLQNVDVFGVEHATRALESTTAKVGTASWKTLRR